MSFTYTPAKVLLAQGLLDLTEAGSDLRVALVMSNSTAGTEEDTALMNAFTTLDECDGANYVRKALAAQVVNQDDPNNRAELDAVDITWIALGAGSRQNVGLIIYKHVTNDADSIPIAYVASGGFPFNGNGADWQVRWDAEGIIHLT